MNSDQELKAFDVLCPCYGRSQVKMIAVVAAKNRHDIQHLEVMRRTFPACRVVMIDTEMHNVSGYFSQIGLLRLFYASLFEYWEDPPSGFELLSILDKIASPAHALEWQQTKQIQELRRDVQAIRASKSWKLTEPFRRFSRLLSRITEG
jgi:hypothetical protein